MKLQLPLLQSHTAGLHLGDCKPRGLTKFAIARLRVACQSPRAEFDLGVIFESLRAKIIPMQLFTLL